MILFKFFPDLDKDNSYYSFYKKYEILENTMTINKLWFINKNILSSVNNIIKNNEFGLLQLPKSKLFFTHFLIKNGFLKYIDYNNNLDLLIKNDDSKLAFEFLTFEINFFEDCINYYIKYNGSLEKNIANFITILDRFIKLLDKNLGVTIFEYIIQYIFKENTIFTNQLYFLENNEGKTLFNVISQYDECDTEILKKIITKYNEIKSNYSLKKLGKLFSKQDIEGKTILMNCLENHQLEFAHKIIIDLNKYLDFNLYDIKGNTLLHYLFLIKKDQVLIKKGELELILNICLLIINESPSLIITQNFEGYIPWLFAAKAGMPGSLLLMSKFYHPSIIEKYS